MLGVRGFLGDIWKLHEEPHVFGGLGDLVTGETDVSYEKVARCQEVPIALVKSNRATSLTQGRLELLPFFASLNLMLLGPLLLLLAFPEELLELLLLVGDLRFHQVDRIFKTTTGG